MREDVLGPEEVHPEGVADAVAVLEADAEFLPLVERLQPAVEEEPARPGGPVVRVQLREPFLRGANVAVP